MCPTYSTLLSEGCYLIQCRECEWTMVAKSGRGRYNCKGPGYWITRVLLVLGVTEERANWVFGLFGKKCHCTKWRNWLNSRK